ncbi:MAG: T9SS type A sorting domain-containing protein [Bacteroidetes bacterium]|nr:T9SS type A sorting domain-containing protein [Bacteroidota bacterium]
MYLTPWGEWLLFAAADSLHGQELWRWKQMGMPAERVTDNGSINFEGCTGSGGITTMSQPMIEYNGNVYFTSRTSLNVSRLIKYKGVMPPDTVGDSSLYTFVTPIIVAGNRLLLMSGKTTTEWYLWSYDDVHPPVRILDQNKAGFNPYGTSSMSLQTALYAGKIYFNADSTGLGNELFSFDPVTNSVSLVSDIWPGWRDSDPSNFVVAGTKLYFFATDSAHGQELYSYDGTTVQRLTDLLPGPGYGVGAYQPYMAILHQGSIYFDGQATPGSSALYRYDTATGIVSMVYSVPNGGGFRNFLSTPYNLYFDVNVPTGTNASGVELYKYDGVSGTRVADLNPGNKNGVTSDHMALFGGYVYFVGDNGSTGWELYRVKDSARGLGVPELVSNPEFQVSLFPNPATGGRFHLSLDAKQPMKEVSVRISDVTGREVLSRQFSNPGKRLFEEMNLSGAAPGMYFVRITADSESFSRKVVVE